MKIETRKFFMGQTSNIVINYIFDKDSNYKFTIVVTRGFGFDGLHWHKWTREIPRGIHWYLSFRF